MDTCAAAAAVTTRVASNSSSLRYERNGYGDASAHIFNRASLDNCSATHGGTRVSERDTHTRARPYVRALPHLRRTCVSEALKAWAEGPHADSDMPTAVLKFCNDLTSIPPDASTSAWPRVCC